MGPHLSREDEPGNQEEEGDEEQGRTSHNLVRVPSMHGCSDGRPDSRRELLFKWQVRLFIFFLFKKHCNVKNKKRIFNLDIF